MAASHNCTPGSLIRAYNLELPHSVNKKSIAFVSYPFVCLIYVTIVPFDEHRLTSFLNALGNRWAPQQHIVEQTKC